MGVNNKLMSSCFLSLILINIIDIIDRIATIFLKQICTIIGYNFENKIFNFQFLFL